MNENIELKSFTDVAIDERSESKAMEKFFNRSRRKFSADKLLSFPTDNLVKIKRVLLMLLLMKEQNQKPRRVNFKQI